MTLTGAELSWASGFEGLVISIKRSRKILFTTRRGDFTGRSEPHPLARAIEQLGPVVPLELPDLRADRRLRAEHFFSRTGEVAQLGHFQKRGELTKIHSVQA